MHERAAPVKPPANHTGQLPWVKLRSAGSGHQLYKRMIGAVDPKARPGDLVAVYDKSDAPYGIAIYNPKSLISLRLLSRGGSTLGVEQFFAERLEQAIELRRSVLGLDAVSDAYRLVHDQGDGMPGIVVDRYADHLVLEFYSLGMFRQADTIEKLLAKQFPGAKFFRRASEYTEKMEGFKIREAVSSRARVKENGVLFEVTPGTGYKTGFFCDQRENRLAVSRLAKGRRMLDICSYTGGFGIYAKTIGEAAEVTCVELDAEVVAQAKRNANINQAKIDFVCVDAFPYLRQAAENKQQYGLVVLDPYKLISSRENYDFGRKKYIDFNRLALSVVGPGGIFVTNSCSGLLSWEMFQQVLRTAAGSAGKRVQILRKSGAGGDHPFAADHPEGEYLKCMTCRVL